MDLSEEKEEINNQRDIENESAPLTVEKKGKIHILDNNSHNNLNYYVFIFLSIFIILFIISIYQLLQNVNSSSIEKINPEQIKITQNINISKNNNITINQTKTLSKEIINKDTIKINIGKNILNDDGKIGVAFIYHILHSNGVARVTVLTANYLVNTGKFNVYLITGKIDKEKEYKYDKRIKRFIGHTNRTYIKELKEKLNIKYFVLNNQLTQNLINYLKSLNTKVIGIFHGVYMSSIFHNKTKPFQSWYKFKTYDAFISVTIDDLYVYKKLGYKNAIFLPNLYTFNPSESPESNLTSHNIILLGRVHDKIKGTKYALEAMSYIVKEVPDAKLILCTTDLKIRKLIIQAKKLNIYHNVVFKILPNISEIFLNSSVLMFTSLCEAFPMAMNEGKAYGLPVVAFNIPFSPPFQSGVITVPHLDTKALAQETIHLLKDYNYRIQKGKEAKLSLNRFNNEETIGLWVKLIESLEKGKDEFMKFQKEIDKKFYNEENAKEHLLMHYNSALKYNKYFRCHKFEDMLKMKYIQNIKECTNITDLN